MLPLLLLIAQAAPADFDAVAAAPASHRILLEDERIRVLRVEVADAAGNRRTMTRRLTIRR